MDPDLMRRSLISRTIERRGHPGSIAARGKNVEDAAADDLIATHPARVQVIVADRPDGETGSVRQ